MPHRPAPRAPGSRAGFSLLELVAAVALLVLLAGVVVPAVGSQLGRADEERALADLGRVARAFHAYFVDTGKWPANGAFSAERSAQEELVRLPCLYANVHGLPGWSGPYLEAGQRVDAATTWIAAPGPGPGGGLRDPWGRTYLVHYVARAPAGGGAILLVSRGANGRLDSSASAVRAGRASGDDVVYVVTRAL